MRIAGLIVLVGALLFLGACTGEPVQFVSTANLKKAYEWCDDDTNLPDPKDFAGDPYDPMAAINVADDGRSLVVEDDKTTEGISCILSRVKASDALVADISATTALMGRQKSSEGGLEYQWSYNPHNGINMTITEN